MRFQIIRKNFSDLVKAVKPFIPTKPSHPVLAYALLEANDDAIVMTGFDLSNSIRSSIAASVEIPGISCISVTWLSEFIDKLTDEVLTVEIEDGVATIDSVNGKFNSPVMSPTDYPGLPDDEFINSFALTGEKLQQITKSVAVFASEDPTQFTLQNIHVRNFTHGLEIAATDGHRLAVLPLGQIEGEYDDNISAVGWKLASSLVNPDENVSVEVSTMYTRFSFENSVITARCNDGQYPNYQQLIPAQFQAITTVTAGSLLNAAELVYAGSNKASIFKVHISNGAIVLGSNSLGDTASAESQCKAESTGSITIAFRSDYFMKALRSFEKTELIQIGTNSPTSPAVFSNEQKQVHLLMPVSIRG